MPSFRVLRQGCSHFSFRFRCSRIEIRPDINNLIKKITTIKRPCEFGTWNTYACFKSQGGASHKLIMSVNTAPPFSYCTFTCQSFAALVIPCCPKRPAGASRDEMFVLGRVRTSLRNSVDLLVRWISLPCISHSFEPPTGASVPFAGNKHDIRMEVEKEIANIPTETQPLFGAAGVVKNCVCNVNASVGG